MTRAGRRALAGLGLLLLLAEGAAAQPTPAGHGGLPSGEGTIVGRVVHEEDGRPAPQQDVVLYTVGADGAPGLSSTATDAEGAFRFEGLATDPGIVYLVGSRSGAVPFGSRVTFAEGQRQLDVELRIAPLSADTAAVTQGTSYLRIDRSCEGLRVNEAHELSNPTSRVVFVPEEARATAVPVFEAELPAEASDFFTPFGDSSLGLEVSGTRVRYWGPVYPGSQELEFGYGLPRPSSRYERPFPTGAERVVLLGAEGMEIRGEALAAAGSRSIEERPYRAVAAQGVAPGASLAFEVSAGEAGAATVSFTRSELWVEVDDAALSVDENHVIEVEGAALEANGAAPLLCLPLPAGAESLRFSPTTLGMGIEPDPSGALAFRGPIPAGTSVLALRYSLAAGGEDPTLARHLGHELPLLSVFIADTGVVPETTRLHRRRTVNRADRRFLHLEGFSIGPDETVEVGLTRLAAPRPLPALASAGFTLLATAAVVAFLSGPLRGSRREEEAGAGEPGQLAAEREAVYAAIRDLDEDFETGKLTAEDHDMLRRELKTRAVHLMERERRLVAAPRTAATEPGAKTDETQPAADAIFCIACGAKLPGRARFCSQCGEKVEVAGGSSD